MTPADYENEDCPVDGGPKCNVLAGDPEAVKLFDALAEKGLHAFEAAFSTEHGFPRIDVWRPVPANGQMMSAVTLFDEVSSYRFTLEDVVLRGLEMSLADVWDFQNDLVATVYVDVESRSINVSDIREVVCVSNLPYLEGGIDL
jgi:hypothetical protein